MGVNNRSLTLFVLNWPAWVGRHCSVPNTSYLLSGPISSLLAHHSTIWQLTESWYLSVPVYAIHCSGSDAEMVDEEGIDVTAVMGNKSKKRKAGGEPGEDGEAGTPAAKPKKERVRMGHSLLMPAQTAYHTSWRSHNMPAVSIHCRQSAPWAQIQP